MVLGGIPLDFHDLMVDMTSILFEDLKERKVGIQLQIWPCGSKTCFCIFKSHICWPLVGNIGIEPGFHMILNMF